VELNETFTVTLGAITGAPAAVTAAGSPQTGTITNDDAATVSLAGNVSQAENLTPQVFTVNLSNPVDVAVTVLFNTSNARQAQPTTTTRVLSTRRSLLRLVPRLHKRST
jgi:malate/lactate dehydrogenase